MGPFKKRTKYLLNIAHQLLFLAVFWCNDFASDTSKSDQLLFTELKSQQTGIQFINQLEYTEDFNAYIFRNFYNGGGVAIGDVDNDGLPDIFFCSNMTDNQLYLNRGDFQFEDILLKSQGLQV